MKALLPLVLAAALVAPALAGEGDRAKIADMVQRHFDVQTQVESVEVETEEVTA